MFQTIVGTTIANLVAAGILAAIAIAAGALAVSFSWSWSSYWSAVLGYAPFVLLLTLFFGIFHYFPKARGRRRRSPSNPVLWVAWITLVIGPFVLTFFRGITISLTHVHPG
jgi:hypothetical protein